MDNQITNAKATVLSHQFDLFGDHPPAKSVKECIVGPAESERSEGCPNWGISQKERPSKRKRDPADHKNSFSTFEKAVRTFLSTGCSIIPEALPATFVACCKNKAAKDLEILNSALDLRRANADDSHKLAAACRVDYREMVDRDGNRRDVRFELDKFPFTAQGLIYNSLVYPLIKELLGGDDKVHLLYAGVMWARKKESGTPQKWHCDGGHLFEHAHQPPHCINVFFPLIDLAAKHGPTEVQTGSHILGKFSTGGHATFGLECKAGDAILFDYRLKHRGGLNVSLEDRPVLYLAYAKPWFRDAGNTRSGQSIFVSSQKKYQPWLSRLLTGQAMPYMKGFDDLNNTARPVKEDSSIDNIANNQGSGERWVLFKMNVQLDNDREETIVVYAGDIALEVSTQFCLKHTLNQDFIPVLADTIQQQMNQVLSS